MIPHLRKTKIHVKLRNISISKTFESDSHLTELREVVLLAERTLPQSRLIITDSLVITFALWPSVSDAGHNTGDQFT